MSTRTMTDRVEEYLAYRHALGYQLRVQGWLLRSFARFADGAQHPGPLTIEIALRWARLPEQAARTYQARRLGVVRTLARYLAAHEPGTEVPPRGLLGPAHVRRPPFLYTEANIAALLEAALALAPVAGLRPKTYRTLIGLLACTGLRIQEALVLGVGDIDGRAGVLTVRQSKFRKTRLVPLHPSATPSSSRGLAGRWPTRPSGPPFSGAPNIDVRRHDRATQSVKTLLAALGLIGITVALIRSFIDLAINNAGPLFVTLVILFMLVLVGTAVAVAGVEHSDQPATARIVTTTLRLAGGITAGACLLPVSVYVILWAVCW